MIKPEMTKADAACAPRAPQSRFAPCDAGEICERCAWFCGKPLYAGHGQCRRHAPKHRADFYQGAWPYVKPSDWCGDFVLSLPTPKALSEGGAK